MKECEKNIKYMARLTDTSAKTYKHARMDSYFTASLYIPASLYGKIITQVNQANHQVSTNTIIDTYTCIKNPQGF